MYSFEGDYRRKPQQNLAGASRRDEKAALLQHAQFERMKREQTRRRHDAAVTIQAHMKSFVARQQTKKFHRQEFDKAQNAAGNTKLSLEELVPFFRTLLFFYERENDSNRLIWLLQHVLKYQKEMKVQSVLSPVWLWRLRWILRVSMEYTVDTIQGNRNHNIAIPLRVLEVFTVQEETERALEGKTTQYLKDVFSDLVKNGYFEQVKKRLDEKVPPMLEASSMPPTPMSKCLFDMIQRPLSLVKTLENQNDEFSILVLREFSLSILSPKMSDPIRMFIIPALAKMPNFPYAQLIACINKLEIPPTASLLYAVLSLEPENFAPVKSDEVVINYLRALASLSSTMSPLPNETEGSNEPVDSSDSDSDDGMMDQDEAEILRRCIELINEEHRVQGILVAVDRTEDSLVLQPLCQLCHNLLLTNKMAVHKYKLLYMLAFKPAFLRNLWNALLSVTQTSLFASGATPLLQILSQGAPLTPEDSRKIVSLLAVFCSLFSLLISTLHDSEFFIRDTSREECLGQPPEDIQSAMPFETSALVPLSAHLKSVCLGLVERAFPDTRPSVRDNYRSAVLGSPRAMHQLQQQRRYHHHHHHYYHQKQQVVDPDEAQMWTHLFKSTVGLLRQLHTRDLRRQFCPDGHWIAANVTIPMDKPQDFTLRRRRIRGYVPFRGLRVFTQEQVKEGGPPLSTKEVRTLTLLREIPFVVPFNDRVLVFQSLIYRDKTGQQGELSHFMQGPSIQMSVRRSYLYEDAFDKLSPENEPELRLKMRVQMVNAAGLEEAGVDGGGLLREFLTELLKTSFDPNRGFFRLTKDNMLYPNPTVHLLVDDFPKHYYFIGRILGKALYENLLVELPFAEFFLSKIVGRHSDVDAHHLASLDPVMYRNLLYLKSYKADVTDLGLDFTVLSDELGERRVDELKPSGANIPVNNHNRIEYIHLMADYKLNKQIRAQCYAFKQGIRSVVPLDWLQMFNNKELQILISGAQIPVDVNDLKTHTNYTGGYSPDHPTIEAFWKVVNQFTDLQKGQLLKFVTSCSRPPLLGFKELDPPFCIQHAGSIDRLPTSSTCMNLLKLPDFPDETTLREKLLYAIQAGAGFELS